MSELSAEAIQKLVDLAREPKQVELLPIPEKRRYALFNTATGQVTYSITEPPARSHKVGDVATVITEAMRLKETGLKPVVWCGIGSVVILDDSGRLDAARLTFSHKSQFALLRSLAVKQSGFPQKSFIRLLRVDLDGCLGATGNFLPLVRQLKFQSGQDQNAAIQHGKESISRSTIAELVGADAIPEEVTLTVRVFDLPAEPARPIRCAVEIDLDTCTFSLTPFPGQLDDAERAAITAIRDHLASELEDHDIPVVFGSPS